jgi:hypothetical protein
MQSKIQNSRIMDTAKLRVGVIINGNNIANWQYKIIEALKNSSFAEIGLVIKHCKPRVNICLRYLANFPARRRIILESHLKLDSLILGRISNYSKPINSRSLLENVCTVALIAFKDKLVNNRLSSETLRKITTSNLSLVLDFSVEELPANLLSIPKYGVWYYGAILGNRQKIAIVV